MSRLLNWLQEHTKKKARNDPSLSSEYEQYINSDFVTLLDNSEFAAFDLLDFKEEILDAEVQQNEAIPLSEEEIALDVASSESTMSGSGSGGEEVDYDMMNYGDDYE
ncbi:hypothetical protein Tco_0134692 [Tanacetum coccineum]